MHELTMQPQGSSTVQLQQDSSSTQAQQISADNKLHGLDFCTGTASGTGALLAGRDAILAGAIVFQHRKGHSICTERATHGLDIHEHCT